MVNEAAITKTNLAVKDTNARYLTETVSSCPKGYQKTNLGIIPNDWNIKLLGDVASFTNGKAHENYITEHGEYIVVNSKFISTEGEVKKYSNKCYCPTSKGNVLMVMSDVPNGKAIAKCFIVDHSDKYTVNQRICSLNINKAVPKYIFYQLNRNPYYLQFDDGVKQTNLRKQDVLSCPLRIPKNEKEQQAIAEALSDVDALIASLEKLIAKKRAIKTATIQQLLTGKKRLPKFGHSKGYIKSELGYIPEDWDLVKFKDITFMYGRIGWQGLKQEEFTNNDNQPFLITGMNFKDGKIIWNEVYHISEDRYNLDKNIQLRDNDVLMTKDGTIGKILYVENIPYPHKASLNSHLLVFRPKDNKYYPKYLYHLLKSKYFSDFIDLNKSGSTFFGITQESVGNFIMPLPSYKEQEVIGNILNDIDEDIDMVNTSLLKTKDLKQGMMQQLLTGRTRLI